MSDTVLLLAEPSDEREEAESLFNPSRFRSLLDVFLDRLGQNTQRLLQTSELPPFWYSAIVFCLGSLLLTFGLNIGLGGIDALRLLMIGTLLGHFQTLLSFIFTSISARQLINGLCLYIPSATRSAEDLADFQKWLDEFGDAKRALWQLSIFCIPMALSFVLGYSLLIGTFAGFGIAVSITMSTVIGFTHVYYAVLFLRYLARLANYDFELFEANPSDSRIVHDLSKLLDNFVYLTAANQTLVLIVIALSGLPLALVTIMALVVYAITLTLFMANYRTFSTIVQRAKWNTMSDIQAQIQSLQPEKKVLDKDTRECKVVCVNGMPQKV